MTVIDKVQAALAELDYPADKDEILAVAESNRADEEVMRSLRGLPPVEYRSRAELLRSIDADPAELEGRLPGEKGPQRREHTHSGMAEHMKDVPPSALDR
ncbi:MAG: DUF2795 domain-containing protein [Actinomycetota bacterium]|nr:DUF2795 domain-containing protein [Actinomycetota bacterium]